MSLTEKVVKLPGVVSVTFTVSVLCVALTPAAAGHKLIAAAMFEAKVVVLELGANVPVVELEHAFVLGAGIMLLGLKVMAELVVPTVMLAPVVLTRVITLPETDAAALVLGMAPDVPLRKQVLVKTKSAAHCEASLLIAACRFCASFAAVFR